VVRELDTDVVVLGGGTGGFAAALAAARMGKNVVVVEETDWIGGQLTSQAVPPDEHPWIEKFGCTLGYRRFRDGCAGVSGITSRCGGRLGSPRCSSWAAPW
jgi:NADPH-dependent 2,4-dienoyl-CoA reductase/sulfur reductase-like enzyme